MKKTILYMILALALTILSALASNEFDDRPLVADANAPALRTPQPQDAPAPAKVRPEPDVAEPDAAEDPTLPRKRAATLLFMGALHDNK